MRYGVDAFCADPFSYVIVGFMEDRYKFVVNLTKEAGEKILESKDRHMDVSIKHNDPRDILTNVDIEISDFISQKIKETFPGENIYSEENTNVDLSSGSFWTIDPIDGTANFSKDIPHFAVVLGYVHLGVAMVGTVYNPVTRELFSFEKDKGAYLNDKPIHVSSVTDIGNSTVLLSSGRKPEHWEWGMKFYKFLLGKVNKLRSLSCSGLDICFVAAGRVELCLYGQLTAIDIIPAIGILKEAGGVIGGPNGPVDEISDKSQIIYAANNQENLSIVQLVV